MESIILPARARTIKVDVLLLNRDDFGYSAIYSKHFHLSFPTLYFSKNPKGALFVRIQTTREPLPLNNLNPHGEVCFGNLDFSGKSLSELIDIYWYSSFTSCPNKNYNHPLDNPIEINNKLKITSFDQWEHLTRVDPDFMQKRLDQSDLEGWI